MEARETLSQFDIWRLSGTRSVLLAADDVRLAETFIRRLDLTLLAPDALHIAMAKREGAALATFDAKMAASAQNLGLDVAAA
jgi:predicted nucleic acid-binding protein